MIFSFSDYFFVKLLIFSPCRRRAENAATMAVPAAAVAATAATAAAATAMAAAASICQFNFAQACSAANALGTPVERSSAEYLFHLKFFASASRDSQWHVTVGASLLDHDRLRRPVGAGDTLTFYSTSLVAD